MNISMKMTAKQAGALYMKSIKLENRVKELEAINAEMHALLERIGEGNIVYIENGEMDDDIKTLLAKADGETKAQ